MEILKIYLMASFVTILFIIALGYLSNKKNNDDKRI